MVFWGVKLPPIDITDDEIDMEVDNVDMPPKSRPFTDPVSTRMSQPGSNTDYEETKVSKDFADRAVLQPRHEEFRASQHESHAVPPAKGDDLDRTAFSALSNLDKTTFKANPDSMPAGIDFDEFTSKTNSQDLLQIEKVLDKHFHFTDSLKQRQQKIRNILSLYSPYKNVNMTLSALEQMNDLGVTNDV